MLRTLYRSFDTHETLLASEMIFPQSAPQEEWVEVVVERKSVFAVVQNCLFHLLHLRLSTQNQVVAVLPPWQLVSSLPFLPLDLVQHYQGVQSSEDPFVETNRLFQEMPVTRTWVPHVGDIVAVQLQDGTVLSVSSNDVARIFILRCG